MQVLVCNSKYLDVLVVVTALCLLASVQRILFCFERVQPRRKMNADDG